MEKTHYEKFGLTENASFKDIKKAYRKLVLKYHPDKNSGEAKYDAIIKDINNIYEILSDPFKRKQYDETLKHQSQPSHTYASTTYNQAESATYEPFPEANFFTLLTDFLSGMPRVAYLALFVFLKMATCNSPNHSTWQPPVMAKFTVDYNTPSVGETLFGSQNAPANSSQQKNH